MNDVHPVVKPGFDNHSVCDGISRYIIIIKSLIKAKERARGEIFHKYVINNYGDTDVEKRNDK